MSLLRGPATSRVSASVGDAQANHAAPSNQLPDVPSRPHDLRLCSHPACPVCSATLAFARSDTITGHAHEALQVLYLEEGEVSADASAAIERRLYAIVRLEVEAAELAAASGEPLVSRRAARQLLKASDAARAALDAAVGHEATKKAQCDFDLTLIELRFSLICYADPDGIGRNAPLRSAL